MEKICKKCGNELRHNDFLCPNCGAIWGDPVNRPLTPTTEVSAESQPVTMPPRKRKRIWLILPITALLLTAVLFAWLGTRTEPPAGESSTPAVTSTDTQPNTSTSVPHEIDPVFELRVEDATWLYEPLGDYYLPGQTVRVRVTYDSLKSCMLFANGVEITDCAAVDGLYWEFSFEMPEEHVQLSLRLFYSYHLEEAAEAMIRAYYRKVPDATDVQMLKFYGQYGDAIVGMLNHFGNDGDAITVHYEVVADYTFVYTNSNPIWVLANDQFITLWQAYSDGLLTEEDIGSIYDIHLRGLN